MVNQKKKRKKYNYIHSVELVVYCNCIFEFSFKTIFVSICVYYKSHRVILWILFINKSIKNRTFIKRTSRMHLAACAGLARICTQAIFALHDQFLLKPILMSVRISRGRCLVFFFFFLQINEFFIYKPRKRFQKGKSTTDRTKKKKKTWTYLRRRIRIQSKVEISFFFAGSEIFVKKGIYTSICKVHK